MRTYSRDDWLAVYLGDCREVLATLPAESVHCVVTSPPYWGLRDYGTATWACEGKHEPIKADPDWWQKSTDDIRAELAAEAAEPLPVSDGCPICGAPKVDQQLGLEPTPEAYVESMVAVFREVRRVLRADGTLWLNLGDSYAADGRKGRAHMGKGKNNGYSAWVNRSGGRRSRERPDVDSGRDRSGHPRAALLKQKDLVGIPWRVAFALQADGWYLRSDIIWSKPNPMPESVTDRPTKAHEYLFLLSKGPRYFFDMDAVREPHVREWDASNGGTFGPVTPAGGKQRVLGGTKDHKGDYPLPNAAGRNIRTVWTIATAPYPGAHFATFPPKLVEPCIKAGTSEKGVCPECGAPWERVVERQGGERYATGKSAAKNGAGLATAFSGYTDGSSSPTFITTGWQPSCRCEKDGGGWVPVPATVLDPFAGSGTTAMVANRLSRRAILIDLNADYLGQVLERNRQAPLGLGA